MTLFTRRRPTSDAAPHPVEGDPPTHHEIDDVDAALAVEAAAAVVADPPAVTFADLGVAAELVEALARGGIDTPFPVQTMTIPDALAGRDVCGKAKTGSGKTLAFGLPLLQRTSTSRPRRPQGLVLAPTRELTNQITDELAPLAEARSLWITAVYGGASMVRQIKVLRSGVDIVVATPGRLNDLLERGELTLADVRTVVIDEADQMADMGFLPQVERILRQVEGPTQTLLFSATLDGAVGELVRRYQHEPVRHEVASTTVTVDTLSQRFIGVRADDRVDVTGRICAGAERALVFVRTTHGADRLAKQLERTGLRAGAIHGRLSQSKRERALAAFSDGSTPVLVATNVAARGLHVDGIELVVHYDPPEDEKVYLHRSGRTARAGERGMVVTLVSAEQERDIAAIQRSAGINLDIVPMRPDDVRLLDLGAWEPPARPAGRAEPPRGEARRRPARGGGGGGGGGGRGRRPRRA